MAKNVSWLIKKTQSCEACLAKTGIPGKSRRFLTLKLKNFVYYIKNTIGIRFSQVEIRIIFLSKLKWHWSQENCLHFNLQNVLVLTNKLFPCNKPLLRCSISRTGPEHQTKISSFFTDSVCRLRMKRSSTVLNQLLRENRSLFEQAELWVLAGLFSISITHARHKAGNWTKMKVWKCTNKKNVA